MPTTKEQLVASKSAPFDLLKFLRAEVASIDRQIVEHRKQAANRARDIIRDLNAVAVALESGDYGSDSWLSSSCIRGLLADQATIAALVERRESISFAIAEATDPTRVSA